MQRARGQPPTEMKPTHLDSHQARGGALTSIGPKRSVDVRFACPGFDARAAAAPPFSGPRSRGSVEACNPLPRQHRFALQSTRTPRMGPAPRGTTAALLPLSAACHAFACHSGSGAGGLGYGRRPPFAVSPTCTREHGVDGTTPAGHRRCPASVGPENVPRATCPRATLVHPSRRMLAKGRKQLFTPHPRGVRRGARAARWSH
jgi:hypothetical protein